MSTFLTDIQNVNDNILLDIYCEYLYISICKKFKDETILDIGFHIQITKPDDLNLDYNIWVPYVFNYLQEKTKGYLKSWRLDRLLFYSRLTEEQQIEYHNEYQKNIKLFNSLYEKSHI